MEDVEIWKDVVGYEGLYQVSAFGRVKRLARINIYSDGRVVREKEKFIYGKVSDFGHVSVCLTKNKKEKETLVHRLVGVAFIPNPNNYPQINHIDNNPSNNKIGNLEWCTQKHNIQHAAKQGRMASGDSHYMKSVPKDKMPKRVSILDTSTGIFYDTIKEAAIAKGYKIKYLQDYLYRIRNKESHNNKTPFIVI